MGIVNAKGRCIALSGPSGGLARDGALLLLFRPGQRPDAAGLAVAVESAERLAITHRMIDESSGAIAGCELLRDGMTYDLTGLAPLAPVACPAPRHRYGLGQDTDPALLEAVALQPGPHLAAGAHSIPVVRTMAGIAADLAGVLPRLVAVAWPPARTAAGTEFFVSSVAAWLAGGAFPSLGFTAFDDDPRGGMVSEGLAWFTGQELRFANELAKDRAVAARLGVRLVNQLVAQGRVTANEYIVAPDGGRVALEPTRDGKMVRVRRA
jgi:hypothetical protein